MIQKSQRRIDSGKKRAAYTQLSVYLYQDLRKFTFEPPSVGAYSYTPILYVVSVRKSCVFLSDMLKMLPFTIDLITGLL